MKDNNKKVSSVEWLADQVEDYIGLIPTDIIDKAKAMHKQEILIAMSVAFMDGADIGAINYTSPYKDWQQYYKETFES